MFNASLERVLNVAAREAMVRRHADLTVEHLLFAAAHDPEGEEILEEMERDGALTPFYDQYREDGWGSAAYHPLMMAKILVYGYSVGMTSARRPAQALDEQVAFRYRSANQSPEFHTIAECRKR